MADEVDLRVALELAQREAAEARREVRILQRRIKRLEELSGLSSDSLMTRAFTVWGYYVLATLMISLPIGFVMWVVVELLVRR